jgi:hypothetical protein
MRNWPSLAVTDELSPARQRVMQRLQQQPASLLITGRTGAFLWDPKVDRSKLLDLGCDLMRSDYATGPLDVFIFTFDRGGALELWSYNGNDGSGSFVSADCFEHLPGLRLVEKYPEEGLKLLEAHVPAGSRVALRP